VNMQKHIEETKACVAITNIGDARLAVWSYRDPTPRSARSPIWCRSSRTSYRYS